MTQSLFALKKEIVEAGRRVHARGYVAANDGNISIRVDSDRMLITPTGVSKGFMTPDQIVLCDLSGHPLIKGQKTSSEVKMHLKVYEHRPEVCGIVHAHPPYATAFGIAGISLSHAILPEVIITLGAVPIIEYGTPGTDELAAPLIPHLHQYDAFILQNHGALTVGTTLNDALFRMETVEHSAQIAFIASSLGKIHTLPERDVEKLLLQRRQYGFTSEFEPVVCSDASTAHSTDCSFIGPNQTLLRAKPSNLPDVSTWIQPDRRMPRELIESIVKRVLESINNGSA